MCSRGGEWILQPDFSFLVRRNTHFRHLTLHVFPLQVAAIYKDSSIGNLINIVIVKLVVIHNEQVRNRLKSSNLSCSRHLMGIYRDHETYQK